MEELPLKKLSTPISLTLLHFHSIDRVTNEKTYKSAVSQFQCTFNLFAGCLLIAKEDLR